MFQLVTDGLLFSYDVGSGVGNVYVNVTLIDDRYHHVLVSRVGKSVSLTVDETVTVSGVSPGDAKTLQFDTNSVYVGGSPNKTGFSGCLKDPRYNETPLPLQGSTDVASAYPVAGVGQGCNCPSLCGQERCQEGMQCVQETFGLCFSFQCVNFSCSVCAKGALCDTELQRCVCPSGYVGDQCDLAVEQSIEIDEKGMEMWIIPAVIAALALIVLTFVFVRRRARQQRKKPALNEVSELSNRANNVRFVTNRRFSDFQAVMSHGDEGGGEGADNRYTAAALCSLGRYRHVSARSDDSNLKVKVNLKAKSAGTSSNSSPAENRQEQEERTPEKVVALQSSDKIVRVPLDSPAENRQEQEERTPEKVVALQSSDKIVRVPLDSPAENRQEQEERTPEKVVALQSSDKIVRVPLDSPAENRQEQEERTPEKVVALQSSDKIVRVPLDSPVASGSSPSANRVAIPDDVLAVLDVRLKEQDKNVERTFSIDETNEYCHEGDASSYASGLSSICGNDHELENSPLDFDFLQGLGPKFKPVTDIYVDDKEEDEHMM